MTQADDATFPGAPATTDTPAPSSAPNPVPGSAPSAAPDDVTAGSVGGIAPEILRAYIERIERLEEEKKALAGDIREVYAEAKGNGFEPKIMRKVVSLRRMDQSDRQEEEELLDLYRRAVGM
jgi:uncharacterized protein (UPF0335 family)